MKRLVAVFLCFGALSCLAIAQQQPKPFSHSDVIAILKDEGQRAKLVELINPRRPDFDFSSSLVAEWQTAGLTKEQLDALLKRAETRAVGYLRTFNTALVTYASTYSKGFPATMVPLGLPAKGAKPSPEKADLVMDWMASGHPGGNYTFVYTPEPLKDGLFARYAIVARPLVWREGLRSFFTDHTAVIRATKENRAATVKDPPLD